MQASLIFACVLLIQQTYGKLKCGERVIKSPKPWDSVGRWEAMIYVSIDGGFKHKCGGSMLDSRTILTAAHCLYTNSGELISSNKIGVVLAQSELLTINGSSSRIPISKLILHPAYDPHRTSDDIALLQLTIEIQSWEEVQLVRIWTKDASQELLVGKKGTVVSYLPVEKYAASKRLQRVHVEFVDFLTCLASDRKVHGAHLTANMFCGKLLNVTDCPKGGEGLVLENDGAWVVRGVAAYGSRDSQSECDSTKYVVFTDVAKYSRWVSQYVTQETLSQEGHWPWHAAIHVKRGGHFQYACGGSIINHNTILTAANCFFTGNGYMPKSSVTIHLGRTDLNSSNVHTQVYHVSKLIPHPEFNPADIANDIALIQLTSNITITNFIHPVCLWAEDDGLASILGKPGQVVGFGETKDHGFTTQLRESLVDVVDYETCLAGGRGLYGQLLSPNVYCATVREGFCRGHAGDGMVVSKDDVWFLRGVLSCMPSTSILCDFSKYTLFTNVIKYREWIERYISPTQANTCSVQIAYDMAGDSGGGLVFRNEGRWTARGMVSVKSSSSTRSHNITDYVGFTDAANYRGCDVQFVDPETLTNNIDGMIENNSKRELNLETCGISTRAGGHNRESSQPWIGLVEMRLIGTAPVRCLVTLINEWYAVGPARCFDTHLSRFTILLGAHNGILHPSCSHPNGSSLCGPSIQRLSIETIVVHPKYNRDSFTNNIALIEFRQAANITRPDITPICLPITEDLRIFQTSSLVAASFERTKQRVVVKATGIVNNTDCQAQYTTHTAKYALIVDKAHFCTNLLNRANDECMIGAPIVTLQKFNERKSYFLRGFVLLSLASSSKIPTANLNVADYLPWILFNMKR